MVKVYLYLCFLQLVLIKMLIAILLRVACLIVLAGNEQTKTNVAAATVNASLEKASFSSNNRLLFIAGLEGTGHHALYDMFEVCNATANCESEKLIGGACMRFDSRRSSMMGLFGSGATNEASSEVSIIENRMREIKQIPGNHMFYIGLKSHTLGGMMSYPNFNGHNKALDNPDIYVLAMLAESVGLDFRVIVLQRSAGEIIRSTMSRGFGGAEGQENEPRILLSSANALFGQLSSLDRKFYECVRYEELGHLKPERIRQLIEFMHPHNMEKDLIEMLKKVKYSSTDDSIDQVAENGKHLRRELSGKVSGTQTAKVTSLRKPINSEPATGPLSGRNSTERSAIKQQSVKYHTMLLAQRLALIDKLCEP